MSAVETPTQVRYTVRSGPGGGSTIFESSSEDPFFDDDVSRIFPSCKKDGQPCGKGDVKRFDSNKPHTKVVLDAIWRLPGRPTPKGLGRRITLNMPCNWVMTRLHDPDGRAIWA